MSVKTAILGILKRGPLYGYEIKSIIEREMGDWTSIAFGSIYFALKKLTEEGYIVKSDIEHQDNKPSRIIYKITEKGESKFINNLNELWKNEDRIFFPLDIALYFSDYINNKDILNFIDKRIVEIEYASKHVSGHRKDVTSDNNIPAVAEAIFLHTEHHLEAELNWLKAIRKYFK